MYNGRHGLQHVCWFTCRWHPTYSTDYRCSGVKSNSAAATTRISAPVPSQPPACVLMHQMLRCILYKLTLPPA